MHEGKPGVSRRRVLLTLAAGAAGVGGCGGGTTPGNTDVSCFQAASGPAPNYCLVRAAIIRSPRARKLGVGQVQLTNIDDNTAVVVVRDAKGFYALSGICTHACCLVALCSDADCTAPTINPGECATTVAVNASMTGKGLLCPCHGSSFAIADGAVLKGPATNPLPAYAVTFDGDDVLVDTTKPVDAGKRV